ncbi:MAG: hypothetical protein GKR89_21220 [Candidatus Latescibacteria bacterium]|nr:hypothetical protein [Candidatus Latescibacterota bacterium]
MRRALVGLAGLMVGLVWGVSAQEFQERTGYRLWRSQVIVEGQDHWRSWETGDGARVIEEDGQVRPRFMRRDINAALDAGEFVNISGEDTTNGGISATGVRDDTTTTLIIDGDPATYWEPDLEAGVENLWAEIDLGRSVIAQRVVVRFVEEGLGDPFLKFRVLVSDGQERFGRNRKREFVRIGQVGRPNKDQRVFSFEIEPQRPVAEGISGEVVRFVRVDMLDSDGPRGALVDAETWGRLPVEDQGEIDYFRRTIAGRQIPVIRESYEELAPEEQGDIRYYRRERPRLAEIEVYSLGDNVITLTQRAQFAEGDFFEDLARRFTTDGLYSSAYTIRVYDPFRDRWQLQVDLGAKFWLERIRLLSPLHPPTSYQLRVSDGSLDVNGEFQWRAFDERVNEERFLQVEEQFPLQEVRLIEMRRLELLPDANRTVALGEIQAYGEGYVSDLSMVSPIIKLDRRQMFSGVFWEGAQPPGTRLEIRTRSGDELIQIPHYFRQDGRETSQALWERLRVEDRGPIQVEELEGPDWSPWSEPYRESGELFKSPSPRLYTRVQVRLRTTEPLRFSSIRRLELALAPPLVDRAVGEVVPVRGIGAGEKREFRLYIRPEPRPGDPGFDRIRLQSSSSAPIEMVALNSGTDESLRFGGGEQLWPGVVRAVEAEGGGLDLQFPGLVEGDSSQVLEAIFRTQVFLPSTSFRALLFNRARPEIGQEVDDGDASGLVNSNGLVVVADLVGVPLLGALEVVPAVFTPNDDGLNDQVAISLSIYQVEGPHHIRVEIVDLSGRRVRDLSIEREQPSGAHRFIWDGRDDGGALVAPGTYLVVVELPVDAGGRDNRTMAVIHVVY